MLLHEHELKYYVGHFATQSKTMRVQHQNVWQRAPQLIAIYQMGLAVGHQNTPMGEHHRCEGISRFLPAVNDRMPCPEILDKCKPAA
jgi:hypothetical protein